MERVREGCDRLCEAETSLTRCRVDDSDSSGIWLSLEDGLENIHLVRVAKTSGARSAILGCVGCVVEASRLRLVNWMFPSVWVLWGAIR